MMGDLVMLLMKVKCYRLIKINMEMKLYSLKQQDFYYR